MIKDFIAFLGALIAFFLVMFVALFFTIGYMDGSAKSAYIKQTKGVDIPWYQATFLHVSVNSVDLDKRK